MKKFILFFCLVSLSIANALAQTNGCTDKLATNYNATATKNDGSCVYPSTTISANFIANLSSNTIETSGLIYWQNKLFTHNDNDDSYIYGIDTNGAMLNATMLTNTYNNDWEEISQDEYYIYIGDFGNNANGNRTDLKILRINKNSFLLGSPIIDTISFVYSNQTDFSGSGANNTDFDCEAMVIGTDSIYLFTKQWVSNKTNLYSMPKTPGSYTAILKDSFNVSGLITGATIIDSLKLTVLCGYTSFVQPFVYLLYDYTNNNYFNGNKRKLNINSSFHQIEGITTNDGLKYYVSNEYLNKPPIATVQQKLQSLNLTDYLSNYLKKNVNVGIKLNQSQLTTQIYPNPASNILNIVQLPIKNQVNYTICNALGQTSQQGVLYADDNEINIQNLPAGVYFLRFATFNLADICFIKQ